MRRETTYFAYNLLLGALSPLIALYLASRFFSGKSREGWKERWGRCAFKTPPPSPQRIWVHAVSAGEVVAALPLLRTLKEAMPHGALYLSVITPAGYAIAQKQAAPLLTELFYAPFDLPWVVQKVVCQIQPQLYVSLESELWPNLLYHLKQQGTLTALVNGRITPKSHARALRYARWVFRWMLEGMDLLLVQSQEDAARFLSLGGPNIKGRLMVTGNTKFDQDIPSLNEESVAQLRADLRLPAEAPVFIAGSTRSAEEERVVVQAFLKMRERVPALCLIMAPRQLARTEETVQLLQEKGLQPMRRTNPSAAQTRCLVLDTMGELAEVYAVASLAFVGNTFPPVVQGGGQNILQPLAHGKPVLYGPYYATIRAEVELARAAEVAFPVRNAEEMAEVGLHILGDKYILKKIEERARMLVRENRGAAHRSVQALVALLQRST